MFDLRWPDAEPDIFVEGAATLSHEGTVKSVVWVGDHTGVTAGEDGIIKYAIVLLHVMYQTITCLGTLFLISQMVGPPYAAVDHESHIPEPHHVHGIVSADEQARRHVRQDCLLHPRAAQWQPDT